MLNTTLTDKDAPKPMPEIIRRVDQAIEAHRAWPQVDLFER